MKKMTEVKDIRMTGFENVFKFTRCVVAMRN